MFCLSWSLELGSNPFEYQRLLCGSLFFQVQARRIPGSHLNLVGQPRPSAARTAGVCDLFGCSEPGSVLGGDANICRGSHAQVRLVQHAKSNSPQQAGKDLLLRRSTIHALGDFWSSFFWGHRTGHREPFRLAARRKRVRVARQHPLCAGHGQDDRQLPGWTGSAGGPTPGPARV